MNMNNNRVMTMFNLSCVSLFIDLILMIAFPLLFYFKFPKYPKTAKTLCIIGVELILMLIITVSGFNCPMVTDKFSSLYILLFNWRSIKLGNILILYFFIGGVQLLIAIVLLMLSLLTWEKT